MNTLKGNHCCRANKTQRKRYRNLKKCLSKYVLLSAVSFTSNLSWSLNVSLNDALETPITDSSCHNYCIIGVCVWLKCRLTGCSIKTSPRIKHYNPDLLVSVYPQIGDNPFSPARELLGDAEKSLAKRWGRSFHKAPVGAGLRVEGGDSQVDQSLVFKEATAVGHPLSGLGPLLNQTGFLCPSSAKPLYPYFSSALDAPAWRLGLIDSLNIDSLLPGKRVIGDGLWQQWGPLWPRTGFVLQKDDAKAAAVIAQRVGNIVTQTRQAHIYTPLRGNGFNKTWLPGELKENRPDTGLWQMLAPKRDRQCYAFGENDVLKSAWSTGRQSPRGDYIFNLWRPYSCCKDRGRLIEIFDIPKVCL